MLVNATGRAVTLAAAGEPPTEVRLWPFGQVRARWASGAEASFEFDQAAAADVMRNYVERGHDLPFDYNHAQLEAGRGDRDARAAGSFELELRGDGLWLTNVRWTEDAENYIRRREYRYLSPAFRATSAGRIVELLNVALTPLPATVGASPLVASQIEAPSPSEAGREEESVEIARVIGLGVDASPADVQLRATALASFEATVLAATAASDREAAVERIEELTAAAERSGELETRVAELEAADEARERERVIAAAVAEGRLTPAQAAVGGWAQVTPLAALRSFLETAPRVVPLGELTPAQEPASNEEINETIRSLGAPARR